MSRLTTLVLAVRELGIRSMVQYALYQLELRSGAVRKRTKPYRWEDRPLGLWLRDGAADVKVLPQRERFFFRPEADFSSDLASLQNGASVPLKEEAEEILGGRFRLFGGPPVSLGFPPRWGSVPLTEEGPRELPLDRHWSEYDLDGGLDFRLLWEPSRFGWCFTLGRAYRLTGARRYADGFFTLLASWMEANPPNLGPHWASAQEVALRMMALIFGYFAFVPTEQERAERLLTVIAAHAERIPATLHYARAQRNNHLLTEAVGLYSAGLLLDRFRQAQQWKSLGRRWIVAALRDQIFEDGGYIQHSTNYGRLALAAGLWAARLAEIHNEPLPEESLQKLSRMTEFLTALVDPESGRVPNLGNNDGSNILPLASCAPLDYRPVLQAASIQFLHRPAFAPGPWDELSFWLGIAGQVQGQAPVRESANGFPEAGVYLLQGQRAWAALCCARFRTRPSHSDQLHLDLWWSGHNLARDPGSYRYGGNLGNALASASVHNGMLVDGREPMLRAGRFLWLGWSDARYLARWQEGSAEALAAERAVSGVAHRRSVVHTADALWVVIDELHGDGRHRGRVVWTLPDWKWDLNDRELVLDGEPGQVVLKIEPESASLALYRAGERLAGDLAEPDAEVLGWWSPTYGYKEPALCLVVSIEGDLPARLATWWRLGAEGLAGLALAFAEDQLDL
ncbi:MAG: alginate lyase family protein [Chloroflexota bacterium]